MSALSNIPPQAVLPLDAYDLSEVERDVRRSGQSLFVVDLNGASNRSDVLDRIGHGLQLPEHFGRNLDALNDCLTELEPAQDSESGVPGFVVVLMNIPQGREYSRQDLDELLEVFRAAADYHYDEAVPFRVFYSAARN